MGSGFFRAKLRMVRNSWDRTFQKSAILETFCALFWPPFLEALFSLGALLACRRNVDEVDTRGTLRNKGFQTDFRLCSSSTHLVLYKASILQTKFNDNFFCVLLFSIFRSSNFWRDWVFEVQKRVGAAEPRSFWEAFCFRCVGRARANLTRGGRAGVIIFCRVWRRSQKWLRRCGAEGFRVFFGFFGDPFSQTSSGPFHTPLFLFRCFSLLFPFFLRLGATPHCTCVFEQLAFNLLIFLVFWGSFYKSTVFPWKRVILVHVSVSPFRSLWLLSLLFVTHTLSFSLFLYIYIYLSLSLFFPDCPLPCCLVFIFTFLVFWVVFCCLVSSLSFHEKNNIKRLPLQVWCS